MNRTVKRLVSVLAVVLALALVACGCAGTPASPAPAPSDAGSDKPTDSATPDDGEPAAPQDLYKISLLQLSPSTSTTAPEDTPVGQFLQEKTGVDMDIEFLVGTDVRQKASLLIAGGDYPDLIVTNDAAGDFKAAQAFVELSDYIANSTNIKNCYSETQLKLMQDDAGEIFWLSTAFPDEDNLYPGAGYYLAMDLLKQNEYPIVRDFYEYQDLIMDYCTKNPEYNGASTIGFTLPTEGWRASGIQYGASRFLGGYPNDGLTVVDQETLEAKIVMNQDFQKEFFKMLNKFWNAGICDQEMFMQTNDQYNAKIASGRVVGVYDQRGMFIDGLNSLEATGNYDRMLVAFPLVLPGVEHERYRGPRSFSPGNGIGITVSAKDPDRVFKFLDDLASEECQIAMRWGIEGEDYTIGEDGKFTRTTEVWTKYMDDQTKKKQGIGQFSFLQFIGGLNDFSNGSPVKPERSDEYVALKYKDYEKEFLSNYADRGIDNFCDFFEPSYDAFYEAGWSVRQRIDTNDPRKIAGETALEITREYSAKLTQCKPEEFDGIWDTFCKQLDALPLAEYEALATQMIQEGADLYK